MALSEWWAEKITPEKLIQEWAITALRRWDLPESVILALYIWLEELIKIRAWSLLSIDDLDMFRPDIKAAIEKLFKLVAEKPELSNYQKARWRAAMPAKKWVKKHFIEWWWMTQEEIDKIPILAFKRFNQALYQALHDAWRATVK